MNKAHDACLLKRDTSASKTSEAKPNQAMPNYPKSSAISCWHQPKSMPNAPTTKVKCKAHKAYSKTPAATPKAHSMSAPSARTGSSCKDPSYATPAQPSPCRQSILQRETDEAEFTVRKAIACTHTITPCMRTNACMYALV